MGYYTISDWVKMEDRSSKYVSWMGWSEVPKHWKALLKEIWCLKNKKGCFWLRTALYSHYTYSWSHSFVNDWVWYTVGHLFSFFHDINCINVHKDLFPSQNNRKYCSFPSHVAHLDDFGWLSHGEGCKRCIRRTNTDRHHQISDEFYSVRWIRTSITRFWTMQEKCEAANWSTVTNKEERRH